MIPVRVETLIGDNLAYRLFHPPRRRHHRQPDDVGLVASEATARTIDGTTLHVWAITGAGAGIAVVGHGIGLTKSASLRQAGLLHEQGYHVLLFDHRNHGRSGSDSSRTELADRFGNDIAACIALAKRMWPGDAPLIVWGFSFSTFPTLHTLRHQQSMIDGALFDSGPGADLDAMLRHFLAGGGITMARPLRKIMQRPGVVSAFAGSAVKMLGTSWPPDPHKSAAGTTPMLFLIGSEDAVIDPTQIRALTSRYPDATTIEMRTGHLEGMKNTREQYAAAVRTFLDDLTTKPSRGSQRTGQASLKPHPEAIRHPRVAEHAGSNVQESPPPEPTPW